MTTQIEFIKKFCTKGEIRYFDLLDISTKRIFFLSSLEAMNRNKTNKNIAKKVISEMSNLDWELKKYKWIFTGNEVDCETILALPIHDIPDSNFPIYTEGRKKSVSAGRSSGHGLSGIQDSILVSAMQKYIRRNNVMKAVWTVIDRSFMRCDNEGVGAVAKLTHIRNRLKIIYLEDIGIANIDLFEYMYENVDCISLQTKKEKGSKSLFYNNCEPIEKTIVDIVSRMAQSNHTRMISYVKSIPQLIDNKNMYEKVKPYLKHFPSILKTIKYIDKNSEKSARVNLTETLESGNLACFYYFMEVNYPTRKLGSNLKGKDYMFIYSLFYSVFKKKFGSVRCVEIADKWYRSFSNEETYFTYFHLMIMVCFPFVKDGYVENKVDYKERWKDIVMYNIEENPIEIDDYVVDIHTKIGNLNRGLSKNNLAGKNHFVYVGSYVEDEYTANDVARELKNFYEFKTLLSVGYTEKIYLSGDEKEIKKLRDEKKHEKKHEKTHEKKHENEESDLEPEESDSEKDYFEFVGRAQITTSSNKFDSYFARMKRDWKVFKKGEIVFVKGPLPKGRSNVYDILRFYIEAKKVLKLPYIDVEKVELRMTDPIEFFGERYNEDLKKSNIRYAGKVNTENKYTFLVYKNLCGEDIETRKYGVNAKKGRSEGSEAWKKADATLVDFDKLYKKGVCKVFYNETDLGNKEYLKYYILALYFRYLFGIVDHADRNFLIDKKSDLLYSVDEENITTNKEISFMDDKAKNKNRRNIEKGWPDVENDILKILKKWNKKLPKIEKLIDGLDKSLVKGPNLKKKLNERWERLMKDPSFLFKK